jgi:geranylgeranyl diphosphate synthase type II
VKEYKALLELFSNHLEKYTSGLAGKSPAELYEPESYILALGGKRLRPLLALVAADLFGKEPELALDAALSVELFHNFSLIHDDILDAAPLRRNKATVHVKWNANIAILSGDVMLVKAFRALEHYEAATFKQLNRLLSQTAIEVCEGQQQDMNFESCNQIPVSDYLHMIGLKTAVLLGCSLKMGAIAAGAPLKDQENLYEFGRHLGLSFQLLDDLLDAFAPDSDKFGKQPGGDILANKKTFLLLKAMECANEGQLKTIQDLMRLDSGHEKVQNMVALFRELGIGELCREEADKHTVMAIDYLDKVDVKSDKKEDLKRFALGLLTRQI